MSLPVPGDWKAWLKEKINIIVKKSTTKLSV